MRSYVGVDVGGARKGFDVALLCGDEIAELHSRQSREAVVALVARSNARVVGIDSPARCAAPGEGSRAGERRLAREVCPIFYTPDEATVRSGNAFYGWIVEGLALYEELATECPRTACVEVFPSAAWTILAGPRSKRSKSTWSRAGLAAAGVAGMPDRTSQDARDAAGAAIVAQLHDGGRTDDYGGIAVPRRGAVALGR